MVKFKIVLSQYDYTQKYYRKVNDFIITYFVITNIIWYSNFSKINNGKMDNNKVN